MDQAGSVAAARLCSGRAGHWLGALDKLALVHRDPDRTFRIGYEHSPPDQYVAADGSPGGPAVEIVREAARRRGIHLQWVPMPAGPEPSLSSGAVDLWPLFADLPHRRGQYFIGEPGLRGASGWWWTTRAN